MYVVSQSGSPNVKNGMHNTHHETVCRQQWAPLLKRLEEYRELVEYFGGGLEGKIKARKELGMTTEQVAHLVSVEDSFKEDLTVSYLKDFRDDVRETYRQRVTR